jgi:hypothetical protein
MRRLVLSVTILAFTAAPVSAAGLSLTWDACATDAGATSDKSFDCANPAGVARLYGVFNSPANAAMLAFDFSIDIGIDAATLPDFWHFQTPITPTGCNDGVALRDNRPFAVCTAVNPWGTDGDGASTNVGYGPESGGPNRARFVGNVYRTSTFNVVAGTNYYGMHFEIPFEKASEAGGACAGCTATAAIVWNSGLIGTPSAGGAEDIWISGAGIASFCATANGATSLCGATPARNKTWGALKSLYR